MCVRAYIKYIRIFEARRLQIFMRSFGVYILDYLYTHVTHIFYALSKALGVLAVRDAPSRVT